MTELDVKEDDTCMICGDLLQNGCIECLPCNHVYHYECLLKTFQVSKKKTYSYKNRCPYCRKSCGHLRIVNGLPKLYPKIHYDLHGEIPEYTQVKCCHIMTRGKNKGSICNRKCQLGFNVCKMHNKSSATTVATQLNKDTP